MNLGKIIKKLIKGILWCFAIIITITVFCVIMFDDEDQHSSVELEQQRQEAQGAVTAEASEEDVSQKEDAKSENEPELDEYINPTDTWEQNDINPDEIPYVSEEQAEQMMEDVRYTPFGSDDPHAIWLGKSFSIGLIDDPDSNCNVVLENVRHEVVGSEYSYNDYIFLDFDITNTSKSGAAFSFGQGNDCIVSDGYIDDGMKIDGSDMYVLGENSDMDFGWKELAAGLKLKYTVVFKLDADMWNHKEIYYQFDSGYRFYLMKDSIITPSIPLE